MQRKPLYLPKVETKCVEDQPKQKDPESVKRIKAKLEEFVKWNYEKQI